MSSVLVFWVAMIAVFVMINRGFWVFTDVSKSLSMFMLEKALGPPIDFVEGKKGSAATTWILHGALWLIPSSTVTFCGLWLAHDSDALHALSSWGLNPSSSSLIVSGLLITVYGSMGMLLIGSAMHIIPELGGTNLATEKNATLMSLIWTLSVFVMFVAVNRPEILGFKIMPVSTVLINLALLAIIVNLLITAASRSKKLPLPGWMMIIGLISAPMSVVSLVISGSIDTGIGQWLATRMAGTTFFLMLSGALLYGASRGSGNPLWSRSLAAVTLSGAILTISPSGLIEGDVAADFLALDKSIFDPSRNDVIAGSFLLALSLIPAIALSANVLATLRGDDVFMENPDSPGMPEINLAAFMIVPITIGALFVSTDYLTGTNELTGIHMSLALTGIWLVSVPASLGSALSIFPEVSGRNVLSINRSRWAFWLMAGGAFSGLAFTMMADFSDMALAEAAVEDEINIAHRLRVLGSILFYGTVLGAIYHSLNMISGTFRGSIVGGDSSESSSSISSPYKLTKETTIRKILAQREGKLDTVVIPETTTEDQGRATEL
ncbi:MAG: hypothetical protein CMA12_05380 [Euryarchaeota archaeon]|nr:hypothetical protein [Euryarchaeota archaeon]OUW22261.1 MAG: hypothetical protein CBD33_03240 [Euryarchaeota archaeon TMED173]|tara:strand:- start:453 stop:2105 length:1653 start_codon:yes stop_codon:yes gene_type:complete